MTEACDVFFAIGTPAMVQPAASLPVAAINQNIMTVEVNPDTTPLTPHADVHLQGHRAKYCP